MPSESQRDLRVNFGGYGLWDGWRTEGARGKTLTPRPRLLFCVCFVFPFLCLCVNVFPCVSPENLKLSKM